MKKGRHPSNAASKSHGGISLCRDILANILSASKEGSEDGSTSISHVDNQHPADTDNISALDQSSESKDNVSSGKSQEPGGENAGELQANGRHAMESRRQAGEAVVAMMQEAGIKVVTDATEMERALGITGVQLSARQKKVLETAEAVQRATIPTAVSSTDGANI